MDSAFILSLNRLKKPKKPKHLGIIERLDKTEDGECGILSSVLTTAPPD